VRDGQFNYEDFYWSIVGLFDDGEGTEIIKYYNQFVSSFLPNVAVADVMIPSHVFGMAAVQNTIDEPDVDNAPVMSDLDRLKAQRAAKRARLAAVRTEGSDDGDLPIP
jgi:hypothetical protein